MPESPKTFKIAPVDWNIRFPEYEVHKVSNGVSIYSIYSSVHELSYVELIFENGRLVEEKKLSSRICSNQLMEGSKEYNQNEIVEFFDFYGCSYQVLSDLDFTIVTLTSLPKYFEKAFRFLIQTIVHPIFPEENIVKGKKALLSQLSHQLLEPDFVSYREFSSQVYGEESTYGYNSTVELIEAVQRNDLISYHEKNYSANVLKVFYCGSKLADSFWEDELNLFNPIQSELPTYEFQNNQTILKHIPIQNCAQTSLKMGMRLFKKSDPDYYDMYVINTIFGDYFGSRLMSQIREKHGLSYDISSTLDAQLHDGIFYIGAELNPNQKDKTIQLIKTEIQKLKNYLVKDAELSMVKNYLNGHLLRLIDGPYQSIQLLKILITEFKSVDSFRSLVDHVRSLDNQKIILLAQKYLDEDKMTIITAGA
ncbi:MAG: pitrilysin family protein [Saprospiraceae bacterium]